MNRLGPSFALAAALAAGLASVAAAAPDTLGIYAVADLAPRPYLVRPSPLPPLPGFTMRIDGAAATNDGDAAVPTGRLAAALDLRQREPTPMRIEAAAVGARNDLRAELRALAGRARGLWAGVAVERENDATTQPLLGLGAWVRRRAVLVGASVSHFPSINTIRHEERVDSTVNVRLESEQVIRTAARASLRWAMGGVELEAGGGLALGDAAPWRWADARATIWPLRPLAIFATASSPAPVLFDSPSASSHRATLGVRLDPWRAVAERPARAPQLECRFRRSGGDWHAVEVHAPGARVVELTGDPTGWTPRRLQQVSAERWRLEMTLTPGPHRVALRVDGGDWRPPPGLPTALDEFGGTVGMLVVP